MLIVNLLAVVVGKQNNNHQATLVFFVVSQNNLSVVSVGAIARFTPLAALAGTVGMPNAPQGKHGNEDGAEAAIRLWWVDVQRSM